MKITLKVGKIEYERTDGHTHVKVIIPPYQKTIRLPRIKRITEVVNSSALRWRKR